MRELERLDVRAHVEDEGRKPGRYTGQGDVAEVWEGEGLHGDPLQRPGRVEWWSIRAAADGEGVVEGEMGDLLRETKL